MNEEEIWKPAPGYEGLYNVSNLGNVFSVVSNRLLKPYLRRGYKSVWLTKTRIEKNKLIHRLVAIAFISNPEDKKEVNHIDGDKNNNSVNNLEWATPGENIRHADRTGLRDIRGENSKTSILTNEDVLEIRRLRGILLQRELAEKFNVKKRTIQAVQRRQNWKHI